jgi:hypothetical protein
MIPGIPQERHQPHSRPFSSPRNTARQAEQAFVRSLAPSFPHILNPPPARPPTSPRPLTFLREAREPPAGHPRARYLPGRSKPPPHCLLERKPSSRHVSRRPVTARPQDRVQSLCLVERRPGEHEQVSNQGSPSLRTSFGSARKSAGRSRCVHWDISGSASSRRG